MTKKEMKKVLGASMISKKRNGNYLARWSYFYRHDRSATKYAQQVKEAFPEATIIDSGDHWTEFKGGASVANQSHFYVEFKI